MSGADEQVCVAWGTPGALTDADVDAPESSGVAASTTAPGLYYTLNDSGGDATLLMFDETGVNRGEQLVEGATNTDWEDLATGPCPGAVGGLDQRCIYIADIGDNHSDRDSILLWVIPESVDTIVDAIACPLAWPDGPRDAETLLVAQAGAEDAGAVRVVTKESDGVAKIFRVGALTCGSSPDVLVKEAEVALDGPATGGVMTETTVVIRTLSSAWVWQDCALGSDTWARPPSELNLGSDPQGEAIGVTADGGFVTTSESSPFRFRLIPCAETGTPECSGCGCATGPSTGFSPASFLPMALALLGWILGKRRCCKLPLSPVQTSDPG